MLAKKHLNDVNSKASASGDEFDVDILSSLSPPKARLKTHLTANKKGNIPTPAQQPAQQHSITVPAQVAKRGPLSAQRAAVRSSSSSLSTGSHQSKF